MRKNRMTIQRNQSLLHEQPPNEAVLKEALQIEQLFEEDEFTVDQLYQRLQKSQFETTTVLEKIDVSKQIKFFAKNYKQFLDMQDRLATIKPPLLPQIDITDNIANNNYSLMAPEIASTKYEEETVMELLNQFSNAVFDRNYEVVLQKLEMLVSLNKTDKYSVHFRTAAVQSRLRHHYQQWIDTCKQQDVLLKAGKVIPSVKVFLAKRTQTIVEQISTDVNLVNTLDVVVLGRIITKLLKGVEQTYAQFKQKYNETAKQTPVYAYWSKWMENITSDVYELISPLIYCNEQLEEILVLLTKLLSSAAQLESRQISLVRTFKKLLVKDLALHIEDFIQVILESFEDILKEQNDLYVMSDIQHIRSISDELNLLVPVQENDYENKCSTKKAILLINAYILLLEPIFDKKWEFLHSRIFVLLVNQSQKIINEHHFVMWDCYNLFQFFEELSKGKLRKKVYNGLTEEYKITFRQQYQKISNFAQVTWDSFEMHILDNFYKALLRQIPKLLYENGKIYAVKQKQPLKVSPFGMGVAEKIKEFFKQFQKRLTKAQLELIGIQLFQYLVYAIEYVIFISYHKYGQKTGVFMLSQSSASMFETIKKLPFKQLLESFEKVYKLSYFTIYGMEIFVVDLYYIALSMCKIALTQKINAQPFLQKVVTIQEKQRKEPIVDHKFDTYKEFLTNLVGLNLQEQPVKRTLRRLNTNLK